MKSKNSKLFPVIATLIMASFTALVACSSASSTSSNGTTYCRLVQE